MSTTIKWRVFTLLTTLVLIFSTFASAVNAAPSAAPAVDVTFTILHTNDFHGQLEWKSGGSSSNPGSARLAAVVNGVRTAVGDSNVLVMDAGDEMQGSLLSNIWKGVPVIDVYNTIGYDVATFGNHEFDWGKTELGNRVGEADYPYVSANIVLNDTGNCATAGWGKPAFVDAAYQILTVGSPNSVKVGVIGVTSPETPIITIAEATEGLCFKDAAASIIHYYDAMKAAGADVIVVLSHLGFNDGGYGYGIPVYGDKTLAQKLVDAGKPANLIIGGHSHTDLTTATVVSGTTIGQAYYNGRKVGRADITVTTAGVVTVNWSSIAVPTAEAAAVDAPVAAVIASYATDPDYLDLINQPVGYTNVPITRFYDGDSLMGYFVNDAIYGDLNSDAITENDVDMVFNNAGGLRADITCAAYPCLMTYGMVFNVLPFGNATAIGTMTGAQILELLHQSATLFKGALQTSGVRYSFYRYSDALPGPQPYAWGAFDVCVINKDTAVCEPIDPDRTYKVATNEFLAPAGQDGFTPFKYMKNITYWGDMLLSVNRWVADNYPVTAPYNDALDGRITRLGDNTTGPIKPLTILHHNDSHGNLDKGAYIGYTQLATLIKQERLHNPTRTLLLSSGDNIQGDAMSYFFRTAPTGFASDGTALAPELHMAPLVKVFNAMGYDAMTLGNHEFNFGKDVFTSVLGQATFPILQANVEDDGSYGLSSVPVEDYVEKTLDGVNIAILGIGNHRIPNYELPSNIPGLTFTNPITKAQELADDLGGTNDVVIALTHIGFTENPTSVEVDTNVDTNLAMTTNGIDAIIGGHSHTDPSKQTQYSGSYLYLPTILGNTDGDPVLVTQAYRYNNYLGEVVLGLRSTGTGWEVVSQTGRYIAVNKDTTPEDPEINTIVDAYSTVLATYNNTEIGKTTVPIDTMTAFTAETNGANLQADASVYVLKDVNGIPVDFHLSGAMTNKLIATGATEAAPYTLKISDMFAAMPYENSLVVLSMNGPQLKAVLERAYRNYYYYKYVPGYGGYSFYTTCMLSTNFGNNIAYNDTYPELPDGNNVMYLKIGGDLVDFNDATQYYNVSTVNYLAAGSCNFNDGGVSLWPLDQIVADTQFYVRDAVIDYVTHEGIVSPMIEGRLVFNPESVTSISPDSAVAGTPGITLFVRGTGFTSGSKVAWNGVELPTTFVDSGLLTAEVSSTLLESVNIADVTVGASEKFPFSIYTFADTPSTQWYWRWVEVFFAKGITTGCAINPLRYCPDRPVTRAEMAVFILRAMNVEDLPYTPTPDASVVGVFSDLPVAGKDWMQPWVEEFYENGITTGCGMNPLRYCPERNVTRAEMAVFLLRTMHGASYTPPAATGGIFSDIPVAGKEWMAPWIEQFYREGITTGCSAGKFCPEQLVTRAEMAVFIDRAFGFQQQPVSSASLQEFLDRVFGD